MALFSKKRVAGNYGFSVPLNLNGYDMLSSKTFKNDILSITSNIVSALSSVKFVLRKDCKAGYEDVEDFGIQNLIRYPSLSYTFQSMLYRLVYDIIVHGNGFLYVKRKSRGGARELVFLSSQPKIISGTSGNGLERVLGYVLNDYTFIPGELLHFKYCEGNNGAGLGIETLMGGTSDLLSRVESAISNLVSNPMRGILSGVSSSSMNEEVNQNQRADFNKKFSTDGGLILNDSGVPISFTRVDESDMIGKLTTLRDKLRYQLASVLGCPPSYLGLPSTQGGDLGLVFNQFIQNCVSPVARIIEDGFTVGLLNERKRRQGIRFAFDLDKALLSKVQDKIASAAQMVAGSLATVNEAREFIGLSPMDSENCNDIMFDQTNRNTINNLNRPVPTQQPIMNGNGTQDN